MRIYLPATMTDLASPEITVRRAHAATPSLAQALPEEDEEGLEASAQLCAADASLELLADQPEALDCRCVIAADVPEEQVYPMPAGEEILPGTVELRASVGWDAVAAIFIDEDSAVADIRLARRGDEEAFERVADLDLLWYDASERKALVRRLAGEG